MSSIIESIARKAKTGLTGDQPGSVETAQNERGMQLIKQLTSGGLALGAGTGAAVALVNYLRSLKQENEVEDESRLNDDTLYIPALKKEGASAEGGSVNRWLAPGLAVTGGILSAGGAYALTQAVYNYLQKKRREEMLDRAQGEALTAADIEVEKAAARMNFYDLATAFPVAVPLLAALASGGVAYAALNKTFPTVKSPKSKYPKRIRQVANNGQVEELPGNEENEVLKAASLRELRAEADCVDSANEFLLLITDQIATEKSATISLTSDLLNRAAHSGISGLLDTYRDGGLEALVESVKGASDKPADLGGKSLAAVAICKSARLAPIAQAIAAAEFQDLVPGIYGAALSQGDAMLEKLAGVASLFNLAYFRPSIEKSAMTHPELVAELNAIIGAPGVMGGAEQMEDALTSDVGGPLSDDSEGGETSNADEMLTEGEDEVRPESDDPIDGFMDLDQKSPLMAAGAV
jgi:hypothetical protein